MLIITNIKVNIKKLIILYITLFPLIENSVYKKQL